MAKATKTVTATGATVTTVPAAGKGLAAAQRAARAPASPLPTVAATKPAKPAKQPPAAPVVVATPVVALRGGLAVQAVVLTGKPYRTAAAHNMDWWATIAAAKGGPVAALVKAGVPTHFIGYTMRRGYLQAA